MKTALLLFTAIAVAAFAESPSTFTDTFLGEPFQVESYDAGTEKQHRASLVHYPFSKAADTTTGHQQEKPRASILYIHGFNDYFFQRELAEKIDSAGYSFYAIDLHAYGRSFQEGEKLGALREIKEYYAEIDSAIKKIRLAEGDSTKLVILGHSTGGLIASLYASDNDNGKDLAAIVLNSPFFEMNYPWIVRTAGVSFFSFIGSIFPATPIPKSNNANYGISLYKHAKGEWDFDTTLKKLGSISIDMGWLHAIHGGHIRIQKGLQLSLPILVMHSSCSYKDTEWSDLYERCDGVLNVEHIVKFGANLGSNVTLEQIEDGLHDLFLSHEPARGNAYRAMFQFLEKNIR